MASIGTIGWSGSSGVYDLVQQYMALERVPMTRLEASWSDLRTRSGVFTDLGTKLQELRSAADDFRWPGTLTPIHTFTADSADTSVVEVTATGSAAEGPHTVAVDALARAHSVASLEFRGDEDASALAGEHSFRLVQGEETFEVSVAIQEGDSYKEALGRIVDAINLSGASVTASLAATDTRRGEYRVLLTSKETGTGGIMSEVSDTSGNLAAKIGLAGSSEADAFSANTGQPGIDASFTVDGLSFVSSTNRVTGALTGITLNLKAVSTTPVTVTVARDVEAVRASVEELLTAYNGLVDYVREKTRGADATGEGRGMFAGNTLFTTLRTQLRSSATGEVADPAGGSSFSRLSQIGITANREGRLSISDEDAFETALETKAADVARLFDEEEQGVAVRVVDLMDSFVSAGGLLAQQRNLTELRERALNQRITRMEAYLARREERLTEQLAGLQAMMAQLNDQQRYINAIWY